ncbi:hypothetical protein Trydic_g12183 [Trypoxylus dichotomus]
MTASILSGVNVVVRVQVQGLHLNFNHVNASYLHSSARRSTYPTTTIVPATDQQVADVVVVVLSVATSFAREMYNNVGGPGGN